jgi:hypothetical protein
VLQTIGAGATARSATAAGAGTAAVPASGDAAWGEQAANRVIASKALTEPQTRCIVIFISDLH